MTNIIPPPRQGNQVDPLLAYIARVQAHAYLWCQAEIPVDDLYALVDERPAFMRADEAVLMIRCATRQIYQQECIP